MVYFCKSTECVSQTTKAKQIVFSIVFCKWMTSSGIHDPTNCILYLNYQFWHTWPKTVVFHIVFCILMTSSGIHICSLKQNSIAHMAQKNCISYCILYLNDQFWHIWPNKIVFCIVFCIWITSSGIHGPKKIVFRIVFCIWMTSSGLHICSLKQHSMSTCRQNKHRYLVEAENAISNCENW